MSERVVRVNELVKREIAGLLRSRYQSETVAVTITDVNVSPDLRYARVYYSVFGGGDLERAAGRFFAKTKRDIRYWLGSHVTLKYTPQLEFVLDPSLVRGTHINNLLDEMEASGEIPAEEDDVLADTADEAQLEAEQPTVSAEEVFGQDVLRDAGLLDEEDDDLVIEGDVDDEWEPEEDNR